MHFKFQLAGWRKIVFYGESGRLPLLTDGFGIMFRAASPGEAVIGLRAFFNRAAVWWGILVLEDIIVLSPLLITEYPPLSDLINHMARIFIIANAGQDPTLAAMYRPTWHIVPNLAIDLIGPTLVNLTSVSVAAR